MAGELAGTSLPRSRCPASLNDTLLRFSIDASVLQVAGSDIRFTHQLLQESLASRVLVEACQRTDKPATPFWPTRAWWRPGPWDVVAELAAEACLQDEALLQRLLAWLATAQPEVAARAWRSAGEPDMGAAWQQRCLRPWQAVLTDVAAHPDPRARAAIGRALAAFDADHRLGIGLRRADGVPDIAWVTIDDAQPWVYQGKPAKPLPRYALSAYPITIRQFQAFIDGGGYADDQWWQGLPDRPDQPANGWWRDANSPRETVNWSEAIAFCNWLSDKLQMPGITLPTEHQWERAAAGTTGREYPWGDGYRAGYANINERSSDVEGGVYIQRTTAVGLYPHASPDGLFDLAGNVWEWCLDKYDPNEPERDASRVFRGGSWNYGAGSCRAACRDRLLPGSRGDGVGFRVCVVSPILKR